MALMVKDADVIKDTLNSSSGEGGRLMSPEDKAKLDGIEDGATAVSKDTVTEWGFAQVDDIPESLPASGGDADTVNGHTVNSDVPADAVFTDTWRPLGTGSTDACAGDDPRLSDERPASDVYSWAKEPSKPSYTAKEVGAVANSSTKDNEVLIDSQSVFIQSDKSTQIGDTIVAGTPVLGIYHDTGIDINGGTEGVFIDNLKDSWNTPYAKTTDIPEKLPADGGNAETVNGHTVETNVPANAVFTDTWRPLGNTGDTACAGNDPRLSDARLANGGNSDTVNGHTVETNVPANAVFTDTWRPLGNTADTACAGNDPRLSDARPANGGTAENISGTVAISHGGTGATDSGTARTNLGLGDAATKTVTQTISDTDNIPTASAVKAYVDAASASASNYLGTITAISQLSTTATKGDFYRVSTAWSGVHVGDLIIAEKMNPSQSIDGINWTLMHNETNTDTTYTLSSGDANGQIKVTPSTGTAYNVDVKGLGSLAFSSAIIPTVNNGVLTIKKNGTPVQSFTSNQSNDVEANITVPTKVSELTNDSGFTTNTGTITGITMNGASKGTSGVVNLGTVITAHQDISGKVDKQVVSSGFDTSYIQNGGTSASISTSSSAPTADAASVTAKSTDVTVTASKITSGRPVASSVKVSPDKVEVTTTNFTVNGDTVATTDDIPDISGKVNNTSEGASELLNKLSTGSSTPGDEDYYISQYVGGGTATVSYHRRPMKALWEYIKAKVQAMGYTGNTGTVTSVAVKMNNTVKGTVTTSGTIDLGTVITAHQSLAGYATQTWVQQQGYKTTDNNTTYSLTQDATDGHKITLTPSSGTPQTITIPDNNTWRGIQNNLTSDSTTDSLSAAQGKELKRLVDSKTSNTGTVTSVAVKMNNTVKGTVTTSGEIDLGTVITSHQDISGKANTSGTYSGLNVGYATSAGSASKGSWVARNDDKWYQVAFSQNSEFNYDNDNTFQYNPSKNNLKVSKLSIPAGASNYIDFSGNVVLQSVDANRSEILMRNGHLRFGDNNSWDWNQWAGLKYTHSSKTINLGIADNVNFSANQAQSGGKLNLAGIDKLSINNEKVTMQYNATNESLDFIFA